MSRTSLDTFKAKALQKGEVKMETILSGSIWKKRNMVLIIESMKKNY